VSSFEGARSILREAGVTLTGWVDADAWDRHAREGTRTRELVDGGCAGFVVVGSAGPTSWNAFVRWLEETPARLPAHAHPFDAFMRERIERADALLTGPRRWFRCAADAEVHLDFRTLGWMAGLGHPSRLGLLLHPEHGPWIALRAAVALPERPDGLTTASETQPPCIACVARHGDAGPPCARACPGGAFARGTWDVDACATFHVTSTGCSATCHARLACPVGVQSRYPDEAIAYHYDRSGGRRALRARLGVDADPHDGDGPHWGDWRARVPARGE
jgi:hypothetical protein